MHFVGGWRKGFTWVDPHGFMERLLKELNDAVHREDPKAETIINLEADAKKINAQLYSKWSDILGLDFYANYKSSSPIDVSILKRAKQVAQETKKPLIVSETGYPSGPFFLGYTPSRQAEYVTRVYSEAFNLEVLNSVGIWRYRDTTWRSFPPQENYFGLINNFANRKPGWIALTEMNNKFT